MIFLYSKFHIIVKRRNLEICKHSIIEQKYV